MQAAIKLVLSTAALALLLNASAAQVAGSNTADPTVSVAFFANDDHDKPQLGVTQSEMQILDNKKPPERILSIKTRTEVPLLLGTVIDVSASQRNSAQYKDAVRTASAFAAA